MSKYENILEKYFTKVDDSPHWLKHKLVDDVYGFMVSENQIVLVKAAIKNMFVFAINKHGVRHTFFTEEELEIILQTIL